jgi:predicted DCC family thiol-disulfide oxidoreductase YuxK
MGTHRTATLVFDGDCGFCHRCVRWGERLGTRVEARPWQSYADLAEVGLDATDVADAVWLVDGSRRRRGHEAIAGALATSRHAVVRLLGRLLGSRVAAPLARPAYDWVARHRHRLPGGTAACEWTPGSKVD